MDLATTLNKCRSLERRAAALYRTWAARAHDPSLAELWSRLAREEDEHAQWLAALEHEVNVLPGHPTARAEGWTEALATIGELIDMGERLGGWSGTDSLLAMALELELTELDAMRLAERHVLGHDSGSADDARAASLAKEALRRSDDPDVNSLATRLLAHASGRHESAPAY